MQRRCNRGELIAGRHAWVVMTGSTGGSGGNTGSK